jgi:uncharacterized protein YuzE
MEAIYDPSADAAYVYVRSSAGVRSVRTSFAEDGAILDRDRDGNLLGDELLFVRHRGVNAFATFPAAARQLAAEAMRPGVAEQRFARIPDADR